LTVEDLDLNNVRLLRIVREEIRLHHISKQGVVVWPCRPDDVFMVRKVQRVTPEH